MKKPDLFQRNELTATLWTFRREFLMVGAFSMVANVLMLTPTLYMLQVYDRVISSQSELTLLAMSLLTLALFGVMAFAEWMRSRVLVRAGLRLDDRLGSQVFHASFDANLRQAGDAPARAFSDLIQLRQFLTGNGIFAFFDAPWAPIYMAVLFMLHPLLGMLGIFFALLQIALGWFGHRHTLAPSEAAAAASAEAGNFLQSKLRNAEVIESMGMLGALRKRWAARHSASLEQSTRAQALTLRIVAWSKFIRYSQQSLALGAGALLVIDGQLSPGGMIATNILMTRALAPMDMIVSGWRGFLSTVSAFRRLEKLLVEFPARNEALAQAALTGQVQLRNVSALANGRSSPILSDINLTLPVGTVLVVLGPSGSGKSTLARVLMGIWPQVSGEVRLDGLPISSWDRVELGSSLGYLPQDIELFDGTLAENIARFGKIDSVKVIEAARSAGMHEVILRFPKGYDTAIGEAGSLLSGGLRQRVGLARAIYGNPSLIVLDEPNANLDDVGEAALVKTVEEAKVRGTTVVLITHRPAVLAVADRVLILRDGRIQTEDSLEGFFSNLRAAANQAKAGNRGTATPTAAAA